MIDYVKIYVKAGKGGNGSVSFHREKYVASGGPDGGDGGNGGSVIFMADRNQNTLHSFRYQKKYVAQNGEDGRGARQFGKKGEDLIVKVPLGTVVKDEKSGFVIADVREEDTPYIIAKGGRGGFGNAHFATPTRQAPKFAKGGLYGQERELVLELKLIADVGLLGFPNVGKSTFLSVVTDARPKIANYHFTTLSPNLGVVDLGQERSFVIADIPGIIEGAAEGVGLGHDFLRHVERTRLLLHVVDVAATEGRDPYEDFLAIQEELEKYNPKLKQKPQLIVANKVDLLFERSQLEAFTEKMQALGYEVFPISAATQKGVSELLNRTYELLCQMEQPELYDEFMPEGYEEAHAEEEPLYTIAKDGDVFEIQGRWIEQVLSNVNLDDYESLSYFQRTLRNNGVIDELEEMGVKEGDIIRIRDFEFEFVR